MHEVKKVDRAALIADAEQFLHEYRALKEAGFINRAGEFFPSVHYPPITMYPPVSQEQLFRSYALPPDGLFDIYAHIPFCLQRCLFCHYPAKLGNGHEPEKERYLAALEKEMDIYMSLLGLDRIKARSVLVGGGTPTFLTPAQLTGFLDFFVKRIDISDNTQFNYDVDPNTLLGATGNERMRIMRDYGVNRLTIGVQSLCDRTLAGMNRHHTAREALDAIEAARTFGYKLNIEFIFGYPGQTVESWINDIEAAMALDVDEIQMYRLKVDAYGDYQGPVKCIVDKEPLRVPSDEEALMMKRIAIEMLLANGFSENIRRVFSRTKNDYSRYAWNQCCMLYDQLGFGLTAFSSLRDRFALNTQHFEEYYALIGAGKLPVNRGIVRSPEEQQRWGIILPLKNSSLRKKLYKERTGYDIDGLFQGKMHLLQHYGLVSEDESAITPTRLGSFFADELVHQFHSPDYIPFGCDEYADNVLNPHYNQQAEHEKKQPRE